MSHTASINNFMLPSNDDENPDELRNEIYRNGNESPSFYTPHPTRGAG